MIENFHFLRPLWLLIILPVLALAWGVHRHGDKSLPWRGVIAPHLLPFLVTGKSESNRWPLLLLLIGGFLSCIALAGPAWRRMPTPFAEDTAALAIVIRVSPSMETEDVQPSRLARSVQKVHDLLSRRGSAKSALIAYAGTAHTVMPATSDAGIIDNFASALSPGIMPTEGDAAADALRLADATLTAAGGGSILWITDSIDPGQIASIQKWRDTSRTPVRLLGPLPDSEELSKLRDAAESADASLVSITPGDDDVSTLARASKLGSPAGDPGGTSWHDEGYWFVPILAATLLPFFRKGWMLPTALET